MVQVVHPSFQLLHLLSLLGFSQIYLRSSFEFYVLELLLHLLFKLLLHFIELFQLDLLKRFQSCYFCHFFAILLSQSILHLLVLIGQLLIKSALVFLILSFISTSDLFLSYGQSRLHLFLNLDFKFFRLSLQSLLILDISTGLKFAFQSSQSL